MNQHTTPFGEQPNQRANARPQMPRSPQDEGNSIEEARADARAAHQ